MTKTERKKAQREEAKASGRTNWRGMLRRCLCPNHRGYARYGMIGITVCDEWLDFHNFARDMGPKPSPTHQIDRIDNTKGYFKENCRWVSMTEQQRNRRDNKHILGYNSITEAALENGIDRGALVSRLRRGWSEEDAISKPVRAKKRRKVIKYPECGISPETIYRRIHSHGWTWEEATTIPPGQRRSRS